MYNSNFTGYPSINNPIGNYGQIPTYQSPNGYNQQGQLNFKTNKILVTSLQEALAKPCDFNTEMVYWDQSKPSIYVIRTNIQGMKEWAELSYNVPNQANSGPATKADLQEILTAIKTLEGKVGCTVGGSTSEPEVTADVK